MNGAIPRWKKELIFVAISKDRDCRYCLAAHIACCRMLGVESGCIDAMVRDVNTLPDPTLRDMVLFCLKCSREPQGLDESDYGKLREHGMTQ